MKYTYQTAPNISELSVKEGLGEKALDLKTVAKDIPCQEACPAKTNVPAYLEAIYKGRPEEAYRINLEDNVFPGVLGRICTRPCEDLCRHNWTNVSGPVQICHLKRAGADYTTENLKPLDRWYVESGKKIAIIGGGPAGLTAARELHRFGHQVTIFEREQHLGGMLVDGIPKFRLPGEVVQKEIELVVNAGIDVRLGTAVDQRQLTTLTEQYDAVLLATGTMLPAPLDIVKPGLQVYYGNEFMKAYNAGEIKRIDGNVVVIGGGFTAVDSSRSCARVAKILVARGKEVTIVYRRSEEFMSADKEELDVIIHEKITIKTLCTPVRINTENDAIRSVTFRKNMLDGSIEGGKPKLIPLEGSDFDVPCEMLIIAIGQHQDYSILGDLKVNGTYQTSHEKVFTVGDFRTGSLDVIRAVEDGKRVADAIDRQLMGVQRRTYHVLVQHMDTDGETGRVRDHDLRKPQRMPTSPMVERCKGNVEVEMGFTAEQAADNASRCYLCHYRYEIDHDKCIHCDWCIEVAPRKCIFRVSRMFLDEDGAPIEYIKATKAEETTYIHIDSDECIRCGKCLRVCPTDAISMKKMERIACLAGTEV